MDIIEAFVHVEAVEEHCLSTETIDIAVISKEWTGHIDRSNVKQLLRKDPGL